MTGTVRLHRVLCCPPERVYHAFLDGAALAKWLPPHGFTCTVDRFEPRVGGVFHMAFTQFSTGKSHGFGGAYLELVPGSRIVYTDRFDDPAMPGEMRVTIDLAANTAGTDLSIAQEGIPDGIPVASCYLGWQQSLLQLAALVEPASQD